MCKLTEPSSKKKKKGGILEFAWRSRKNNQDDDYNNDKHGKTIVMNKKFGLLCLLVAFGTAMNLRWMTKNNKWDDGVVVGNTVRTLVDTPPTNEKDGSFSFGSSMLSLCYSWFHEDSQSCDSLAWFLQATPPPRSEDSFDYSLLVLASPKRIQRMKRNLHQLVPYQTVPAFDTNSQYLDTSDTKSDWDWLDHRMRIVDNNVHPGEAGCTLGHRRVLEEFLRNNSSSRSSSSNNNNNNNKRIALILEDDAVPIRKRLVLSQLDELVKAVEAADPNWDFVQLGRCWDIKCHDEEHLTPVATLSHGSVKLFPSQGFEFCSHSYLVSRRGAEKIMQFTLPMVLPYDLTIMLHSRNKLLNAYFTSENFFDQDESLSSLIRKKVATKPVCHPGMTLAKSKLQSRRISNSDPVLLQRVAESSYQEMVSVETRRLRESPNAADAEKNRKQLLAHLCATKKRWNKSRHCISDVDQKIMKQRLMVEEIHSYCQFFGGSKKNATLLYQQKADPASRQFLDEMDKANLKGIVIWGLRPDVEHTHKYIHGAIHKAAAAALAYSQKRRHLCYVPENTVIDLGRHLYHKNTTSSSLGKLARSLVFASPKHMTWSDDPGFVMLPIEATSRYIFHGQTPRPHTVLQRDGFAAEWEAWGPDGWTPDVDSDAYVRQKTLDESSATCQIDSMRKTKSCPDRRLFIQPWAAYSTPAEIQENKKYVKGRAAKDGDQYTMHFQGSIWHCNIDNFLKFVKGCAKEGIEVIRYGENLEYEVVGQEQLFDQDTFFMEQTELSLQQLFEKKGATYGPSFQGECHIATNASESYIADRILNLIAIGIWPMTNNPASYELLENSSAIVFDPNVTKLCRKATMHHPSKTSMYELMDMVAQNHTYISRLTSILRFVNDEIPRIPWRDTAQSLVSLDTKDMKMALNHCAQDIECVLARVPVHPSWNCKPGVLFGGHNRMGNALAGTLREALPLCGSEHNDHMVREDYSTGRPVIHFIRDPLEVVVSGYQYHSTANTTWLEESGYKSTLLNKSLANGLEKEFHGPGLWNIENAAGVHQMMKHDSATQKDFFVVRIDDVRDATMLNLTAQAIQKWLGIDQPVSWKDIEKCCFWPEHVVSVDRKQELRSMIMNKHSKEIYTLREELDFPTIGFEVWSPPPIKRRVLVAFLLVTLVLSLSVCFITSVSALSSKISWREKKSTSTPSASVFAGLIARFGREFSSDTGLFQLRDPFCCLDLDVQETFAPGPAWRTRCVRLVLFLWSLHVLWVDMHLVKFPWFYFAIFSQVTFGLTLACYFVSLVVAFAGPLKQPETTSRQNSKPSPLVCFYWAFYAGVLTCQFVVTTVHWATNLNFFLNVLPVKQRYPSVMKHGIFFLLTWWEGQVYSRIPLRAKLYVFPMAFLLLYTAWTYYQSLYGPSNPFFYGQDHEWAHPDDDDAIYPQLNWNKRPARTIVNVFYGTLFAPLHFIVLWIASAWSGGSQFDGKHRRFVLKKN